MEQSEAYYQCWVDSRMSKKENKKKGKFCANLIERESAKAVNAIQHSVGFMRLWNKFLICVAVLMMSVLVYWGVEKDPFELEATVNNPELVLCTEGVFHLERYVRATKPLTIQVVPRLTDMITDTTYMLEGLNYNSHAGEGVVTHRRKVRSDFPSGLYIYHPYIVYKINPIKTIQKEAPSQVLVTACDLPQEEAAEISKIIKDNKMERDAKIEFIRDIILVGSGGK